MSVIRSLRRQLARQNEPLPVGSNISLGLPLESNGRTIYPVYRESSTSNGNGPQSTQIGYLEISGDRSDFVSLEATYRPVAAGIVLLALLLVLTGALRRAIRG